MANVNTLENMMELNKPTERMTHKEIWPVVASMVTINAMLTMAKNPNVLDGMDFAAMNTR